MSLRLTPRNLEAAYEYLITTAPFNKWKLPDADDLEFHVTSDKKRYGHLQAVTDTKYTKTANKLVIALSGIHSKTTHTIMETMAHECCHLKRFLEGGHKAMTHGPRFKKLARAVCKAHGFDIRTF